MKELEVKNLCNCPKCNTNNIVLLMNARNYFQVRCKNCGYKTAWGKKIDVVIDWFNSAMKEKNQE